MEVSARVTRDLSMIGLEFQPGWRRQDLSLADALLLGRDRDRIVGHTSAGPHRADWSLTFSGGTDRNALSRGQTKLAALSALLAQAGHYAERQGHWPVIALDDLTSELDRDHQQRVLGFLQAQAGLQLFITAAEASDHLLSQVPEARLFHVEQGRIVA
jgi:DNA replication and repair protein RecF